MDRKHILVKKGGKDSICNFKSKNKSESEMMWRFLLLREWFWLLEWADVDHLVLIGANTECSGT